LILVVKKKEEYPKRDPWCRHLWVSLNKFWDSQSQRTHGRIPKIGNNITKLLDRPQVVFSFLPKHCDGQYQVVHSSTQLVHHPCIIDDVLKGIKDFLIQLIDIKQRQKICLTPIDIYENLLKRKSTK